MNLALRLAAASLALLACTAAARADVRVEDRRMRVRLDPVQGEIEGLAVMTVVRGGESVLALELAGGLRITSLLLDGAAVEPVVDTDLGNGVTIWRCALPGAPEGAPDLRGVVSVSWSGTFAAPPGGAFSATAVDLPATARWAPTPQHPAPWRVDLDVPAGLRGVMRGVPGERRPSGDRAHEAWASALPARGLPLAAGPWEALEAQVGERVVAVWGAAPDEALLRDAAAAFERVTAALGPCPAPRFDVLPDAVLLAAAAPGLGSRAWGDLGTQAARCWWGHAVPGPPGDDGWSDALARYTARVLAVEPADPMAARALRRETLARLSPATASTDPGRVLLAFDALREEIGPAAFDAALHGVLRERTGRETTWDDWSRAFSAAAGRDVSSRVEQWTRRRGAPLLELGAARLTVSAGRLRLAGTIRQSLPDGEEPWRLDVPLVVELVTGSELVDITVGGAETAFSVILSSLPVAVVLDPDFRVPRRLSRGPGEDPPVTTLPLLPDIGHAGSARRVAALHAALARAGDGSAARRRVQDELGISGIDVAERRIEVEVRARAAGDVVTVDGAPAPVCLPLTCSPETPDEGLEPAGVALDPGDDLAGRALVVDVPGTTRDLRGFARGIAPVARAAGAVALVLRVGASDTERLAGAWRTPAEAPVGHPAPVVFAHAAQASRGADLSLPTLVAPAGFAPGGPFRVRVRWRTERAGVSSVRATVAALHGRPGAVVVAVRVGSDTDPATAATAVEALQLVAPHAALLGRDVELLLLPDGDAHVAAVGDLLERLAAAPAAVLLLRPHGPRGGDALRIVPGTDAEPLARLVAACVARAGLRAADAGDDGERGSMSAFGPAPCVVLEVERGNGVGAALDAGLVSRSARALALSLLAASVAP